MATWIIETINSLNRKNDEAARIMAKHEQPERDPHQSPDLKERQAHAHEVMGKILDGAKG